MGKKKENTEISTVQDIDKLLNDSVELIRYARSLAARQVNMVQLLTFFTLGEWIVEAEQSGSQRAAYGKKVLERLSEKMTAEVGKGFSIRSLGNMRQFFVTYKDRIRQTPFAELDEEKRQTLFAELEKNPPFMLSWSHYLQLIRIENDEERSFYEIEASKENWSVRTLQRQHGSSLYERLALSRDKNSIHRLALKGNELAVAGDIIKDPYVLEFVGLDEKAEYSETDLESRLITHLQSFLLELGTGYSFVARQKRFTFNEDHFRVDLVFYNRHLRCFVLFDLKVGKLKHQDLGQMQMYVNYYDRYEKREDENPTIGVLLCSEKDDEMVKLTLPENANIYASEYKLYLPDKKLLQQKLREWLAEEGADEDEV